MFIAVLFMNLFHKLEPVRNSCMDKLTGIYIWLNNSQYIRTSDSHKCMCLFHRYNNRNQTKGTQYMIVFV